MSSFAISMSMLSGLTEPPADPDGVSRPPQSPFRRPAGRRGLPAPVPGGRPAGADGPHRLVRDDDLRRFRRRDVLEALEELRPGYTSKVLPASRCTGFPPSAEDGRESEARAARTFRFADSSVSA